MGLQMSNSGNTKNDDYGQAWEELTTSLSTCLGDADDSLIQSEVPFYEGADAGGFSDVLVYSSHLDGKVYVTADCILSGAQIENVHGSYELMIVHRDTQEWGPGVIAQLAYYTLAEEVSPGETIDVSGVTPDGSSISALLFLHYADLTLPSVDAASLMLCIGITDAELDFLQSHDSVELVEKLKANSVFPYTDLHRDSVI